MKGLIAVVLFTIFVRKIVLKATIFMIRNKI